MKSQSKVRPKRRRPWTADTFARAILLLFVLLVVVIGGQVAVREYRVRSAASAAIAVAEEVLARPTTASIVSARTAMRNKAQESGLPVAIFSAIEGRPFDGAGVKHVAAFLLCLDEHHFELERVLEVQLDPPALATLRDAGVREATDQGWKHHHHKPPPPPTNHH